MQTLHASLSLQVIGLVQTVQARQGEVVQARFVCHDSVQFAYHSHDNYKLNRTELNRASTVFNTCVNTLQDTSVIRTLANYPKDVQI